ncbi:MAG: hypothetical protein AVDCRST_MAG44-712 [uncultured Sphingomonas sp.]|uniref:histidine kinase n=1 Tax=uncultured Sphingomonas sp. TaxID=158754 RepID=A0A6J4SPG7_9SPHN|nr:MAG: hypothetical protein AVDCRST_MAG44-712 [uncultured Sphingomonas sp.]
MRFDDRLLTVLNQPASDRHDAAVRWRQLVDLVARAGSNSASPVVAQALEQIRDEAAHVEEPLRAAAARAVAALPLPLALLEYFASDQLSVAAPVLAAATLEAGQWRAILAAADEETRRFVETLHPELSGAEADLTTSLVEPAPEAPPPPPPPQPPAAPSIQSSLSEVVARIERRRAQRELRQPAARDRSAPPPAAGAPALFRWECGPSGEIAWVEGAPRGPLIGRSIARTQEVEGDRIDEDVVRAFAMRAPFRDGALLLAGDGLVAGEWKISGVPAFEPTDGRFAGYRGIALRDMPAVAAGASEILSDPDSLRELVHEIKTPLNAIIGFAEIIDGQYLGPADRRYRERAGEIVEQARLLLAAIDDLDFAAKVHSGASGGRVNLADLIDRAADQLRALARERQVELEFAVSPQGAAAAVEPEIADRLIFRMSTAVIGTAQPGERLRLSVDQAADQCRYAISRPAALRGLSDRQLIDAASADGGAAFSLRLVRGLARIAGGDMTVAPAGFTLLFPRA